MTSSTILTKLSMAAAGATLITLGITVTHVSAAHAAPIVLDFEGFQQREDILNYYDGGFGSLGSGPGPNYGIAFGADSFVLNSGNYSNNPSKPSIAFLTGTGAIINKPSGFDKGFSFYYSAPHIPGYVFVYDGLDGFGGTGNLLASLYLPVTLPPNNGIPGPHNNWIPIGIAFNGTARSIYFNSTARFIAFDNVTLGSETPGTPVPEPLTILGSGIALGFGSFLKRKLKASKSTQGQNT